jgi:hypothetical protein
LKIHETYLVEVTERLKMFYPQNILFLYNFSGILNLRVKNDSEVYVPKILKYLAVFKIIFAVLIFYEKFGEICTDKNSYFNILNNFSFIVVGISSIAFNFSAVAISFSQILISEKIAKFYVLISKFKLNEKFQKKNTNLMYRHLMCNVAFVMVNSIGRTLSQITITGIKQFIVLFLSLQTYLTISTLLCFFNDIHRLIIFGYLEIKENLNKKIKIKENLQKLNDHDKIIEKFLETFSFQLFTLTLSYTGSVIFFVRIFKSYEI